MVMESVPFFLVGNTSSNGPVSIAMLVYWSVLQVLLILDWFLRMTFILGFGHCKSSPFYINILGKTVDGRNPKQPVEVGSSSHSLQGF